MSEGDQIVLALLPPMVIGASCLCCMGIWIWRAVQQAIEMRTTDLVTQLLHGLGCEDG